jgi:P27 family predicted phage terminase small subunit
MRGRKPKPTLLKIIEGSKSPVNPNEPVVTGDLDAAPDWFTPEQKASWDYAIANSPNGLLKRLDRSVLTTWVVAENLHREATMQVSKLGLIIKSPVKGEPMQNPWLAIVNRQALLMMKASSELGFSPTSRSRVTIDEKSDEANPFAQFANRR